MFKDSLPMGTFSLPPPLTTQIVTPICMISKGTFESKGSSDHWVMPNPYDIESFGASMPISVVHIVYQEIQLESNNTEHNLQQDVEFDQYFGPSWVLTPPPSSHDFLEDLPFYGNLM